MYYNNTAVRIRFHATPLFEENAYKNIRLFDFVSFASNETTVEEVIETFFKH